MTPEHKEPVGAVAIRIEKCSSPGAWYESRVGKVFEFARLEINRSPSQGIPEDVYWCRTGDHYNTINYVRASDATVLNPAQPVGSGVVTEEHRRLVFEVRACCEPHAEGYLSDDQAAQLLADHDAQLVAKTCRPLDMEIDCERKINTELNQLRATKDAEIARLTKDRDDWKAKHWTAHEDCQRQFLAWKTENELVANCRSALQWAKEEVQARDAQLTAAQERERGLREAIASCVDYASGRESEWGERAESAFGFLYAALATSKPDAGGAEGKP